MLGRAIAWYLRFDRKSRLPLQISPLGKKQKKNKKKQEIVVCRNVADGVRAGGNQPSWWRWG